MLQIFVLAFSSALFLQMAFSSIPIVFHFWSALLVHLHSNGPLHGPLGSGQALLLKPDERRGEVNTPGPEAQRLQDIAFEDQAKN